MLFKKGTLKDKEATAKDKKAAALGVEADVTFLLLVGLLRGAMMYTCRRQQSFVCVLDQNY